MGIKNIIKEVRRMNKTVPVITKLDYDKYWQNYPELEGLTVERQRVLNKIKENSTVLDIGCGGGRVLNYLKNRKVNAEGIDFSAEAVKIAKGKGFNAEVADIMKYDYYKKYDYLIIFDVLEHIADPEALMLKIRDKFRKNLIISVPNMCFWSLRLRMMLGYSPTQIPHGEEIHWGGHIRFWSLKDLRFWLKSLGYKTEEFYPQGTNHYLKTNFPNLFATDFLLVLQRRK